MLSRRYFQSTNFCFCVRFNVALKKKLINRVVLQVRAKLAKLLSSKTLADQEHIVLILDCWSVNLSQVSFLSLSLEPVLMFLSLNVGAQILG